MANKVNVRVELKKKYPDRDVSVNNRNFKEMMQTFRKLVNNSGVMHEYKEHQTFESKSEKRRKKRKEARKKRRMEMLEEKILRGERVKAPSGIVRKVLNKDKKQRRTKR